MKLVTGLIISASAITFTGLTLLPPIQIAKAAQMIKPALNWSRSPENANTIISNSLGGGVDQALNLATNANQPVLIMASSF